jgi:hypothetical protein
MATPTYAAIWSDNGNRLAGSARLGADALDLTGSSAGREARRRIAYADISSMHMARNGEARVAGRPAVVVVARGTGSDVRIAMTQPGALHEFMESLTKLLSQEGAER